MHVLLNHKIFRPGYFSCYLAYNDAICTIPPRYSQVSAFWHSLNLKLDFIRGYFSGRGDSAFN